VNKVYGGTPKTSESICLSCRLSQIVRGTNLQQIVYCNAVHPTARIGFPVYECTTYENKSLPSRYEMEQIAWTVQSRNRGPIGFTGGNLTEITIEPPSKEKFGVPVESKGETK
jgi:hypothetical protein